MGKKTRRTVIVTGAARGVGHEVCVRFAVDGWRIIGVDLDENVEKVEGEISGARSAMFDVRDEAKWAELIQSLDADSRDVEALVNCAGILASEYRVADTPLEVWRRVIDVNLTGTFVSCKAVLPLMTSRKRGFIVNLASIAGKEGNAMQAAYSAAKGGVIALTKALAKEVAADGVTVNAVAPTMIEGPLSASMSDELRAKLLAKIPMGRLGRPEEVAAMVAWICSGECSFTTGSVFDLSGGRATY